MGIDFYRAPIHQILYQRQEPTIGIAVRDLKEINTIGQSACWVVGFGVSVFSGAFWLSVEKVLEKQIPEMVLSWAIYGIIAFFGVAILLIGIRWSSMRRSKIDTILREAGVDLRAT